MASSTCPTAAGVSPGAGREHHGRPDPGDAIGLALAHHGLVVWGDDVRQTHARLSQVVTRIDEYLATCRRGRQVLGPARTPIPPADQRSKLAELVLPVVRGILSPSERVILNFDDADDVLATLAADRIPELAARGMATPEHLLRAGRLPIWLDLDPTLPADRIVAQVRNQLADARTEYEEYHRRHAAPGERPLDDWAKVMLAPGLGLITAFADKRGAVTANAATARCSSRWPMPRRWIGSSSSPRRTCSSSSMAAGASEDRGAAREGAGDPAAAPAHRGDHRRWERHRKGRRAAVRGGGRPRRGGGSRRRVGRGRGSRVARSFAICSSIFRRSSGQCSNSNTSCSGMNWNRPPPRRSRSPRASRGSRGSRSRRCACR